MNRVLNAEIGMGASNSYQGYGYIWAKEFALGYAGKVRLLK